MAKKYTFDEKLDYHDKRASRPGDFGTGGKYAYSNGFLDGALGDETSGKNLYYKSVCPDKKKRSAYYLGRLRGLLAAKTKSKVK